LGGFLSTPHYGAVIITGAGMLALFPLRRIYMDLSSKPTRRRLAAVAAAAGVIFIVIGLTAGNATVWIVLGVCWLLVALLALLIRG
jgi:hypothetical protein